MHLFSQLFTIYPTVSPVALSSFSPTSIPPLVGDAAHQPPPHFDPVHHVRVIRGHASSGEPPQRHCLQLRPRADQRHGTTNTQIWSRALSAPAVSNGSRVQSVKVDLYNQRSGVFFPLFLTLKSRIHLLIFIFWTPSLSFPGESRVRGEPDRCRCGDVGHHHLGGSSLQPD